MMRDLQLIADTVHKCIMGIQYIHTHITSQHGRTALIIAVQNGDEDVVKLLLNAKADLRLQDEVIVLP